eukprot:1424957-Rhodomonas_salina.1
MVGTAVGPDMGWLCDRKVFPSGKNAGPSSWSRVCTRRSDQQRWQARAHDSPVEFALEKLDPEHRVHGEPEQADDADVEHGWDAGEEGDDSDLEALVALDDAQRAQRPHGSQRLEGLERAGRVSKHVDERDDDDGAVQPVPRAPEVGPRVEDDSVREQLEHHFHQEDDGERDVQPLQRVHLRLRAAA